ncbi:MAG: ImmA/IrrE family metallo-endopeptidase [Geobacter sp.]|nr:MAG: ImmA/IrrE family metallo-endopeptidase [Geobacter sp.]
MLTGQQGRTGLRDKSNSNYKILMSEINNKGIQFEKRVFSLFKEELEKDRLFVKSESCKIYYKKGYFSKDRDKNITFDISIEVFLPGESDYSILIVLECKDYTHPVPVDDVEEFFSKLQQISGANIKGIVVSSNSFQEGAFNFSKSKGIGLARLIDGSKFKWILKRAATGIVTYKEHENAEYNIQQGLTEENFVNNQIDFYGFYNNKFTYSARFLFEYLLQSTLEKFEGIDDIIVQNDNERYFVPFIPQKDIENKCQAILDNIGYTAGKVSFEDLLKYLETSLGIVFNFEDQLGYDELGFEILGKTNLDQSTIFISKKGNENSQRKKYTITHEVGHIILEHKNYLSKEYYAENDLDGGGFDLINLKDIKRLEWQANYFASSLLIPKNNLLTEFYKLINRLDLKDRGYGALYVDKQQCNLNNFYKITNLLKQEFDVSRKAVSIRLKNLNLLNDPTGFYS